VLRAPLVLRATAVEWSDLGHEQLQPPSRSEAVHRDREREAPRAARVQQHHGRSPRRVVAAGLL